MNEEQLQEAAEFERKERIRRTNEAALLEKVAPLLVGFNADEIIGVCTIIMTDTLIRAQTSSVQINLTVMGDIDVTSKFSVEPIKKDTE